MASKKASDSSPVSAPIAALSASEVRGPVATITDSQSSGGMPATSPRSSVTSGSPASASVTAALKRSRSTASAPPAGSRVASPQQQDERAGAAHLLVQQADRVVFGIVGAEGVGADELRQPVGMVRVGRDLRAHLVQPDRDAGARDLPGGLAAGEPAADDVDGSRVAQGCPSPFRPRLRRGPF